MKKLGVILICAVLAVSNLIFMLIGGWAVWELYGIAVNNIAAAIQTGDMENSLSNSSDTEILDTCTFVENHSGTGNHCDLVSAAVVRYDGENEVNFYYYADKAADIIKQISELNKDEYFYQEWSSRLDFPDDETNCYLLIEINGAPFKDNIMGH